MVTTALINISGFIALFVTIGSIWLLRPLAIRLGLVDKPGGRKKHQGAIPLIGGIGMFLGFAFAFLTLPISLAPYRYFIAAAAVLIFVGVLDDFHELSPRARFTAQIFAGLIMTLGGHTILHSFGNLLFFGDIHLSYAAIPITLFAVTGVINAVNMTDGVDGLAGSLAFVELLLLTLLAWYKHHFGSVAILSLVLYAILGFLFFNFRFNRSKQAQIFMGDAGSMFIGFVLAWFFVNLSQGTHALLKPVIMLWIFAIPLFDTTWLLLRRSYQGRSPLAPGRDHLHHLLQDMGFSNGQTTLLICLCAVIFGIIGLVGDFYHIEEGIMFLSFLVCFGIYMLAVGFMWKDYPQLMNVINGE